MSPAMLRCPHCGSFISASPSATADWTLAEHIKREHPAELVPGHLPAPLGDATGQLDVDTLRKLAPEVRDGLIHALRSSATVVRAGRGTVVVPEDTYDLVRRLTAAQEVLRQWAQAFTDAAAEAASLVEEEAMTVAGSEQDGVLTASLFVPDGEGQRIAVRADWKSGDSTWDVSTLVAWLVDDEVADYKAADALQTAFRQAGTSAPMMWNDDEVREVARNVADRLLALGRFTPGARAVEELRRRLAGQQRDGDAAVIRQVRTVGPRTYAGVKITREEAK